MAVYVTITDSQLDPDAPLTSQLAYQWRDNPEAMFEGAAGAPRLQLAALENPTAGAVTRSKNNGPAISLTTTYVDAHSFGFGQTGTVRVTAEHRVDGGAGGESRLVISRWRNSVSTDLVTYATSSSTYVARSLDVSIIPGDTVIIYHALFGGTGSPVSQVINAAFSTNGEALWPFAEFVRME